MYHKQIFKNIFLDQHPIFESISLSFKAKTILKEVLSKESKLNSIFLPVFTTNVFSS